MVQKCFSCGSTRTPNIKLHGFPNEINLRQKWISALTKSAPFVVTQHTRLCSQHFTNDDYYNSFLGNPILKPDAVPSMFFNSRKSLISEFQVPGKNPNVELTSYNLNNDIEQLIVEEEVREEVISVDDLKNLISMDSEDKNSMPQSENVNINKEKKRKLFRYKGDFCEEDLETPTNRKMFWIVNQKMIKKKDDKIKMLQQSNQTLKTKMNSLNNLIQKLKEQNNINSKCSCMSPQVRSIMKIHSYALRQPT